MRRICMVSFAAAALVFIGLSAASAQAAMGNDSPAAPVQLVANICGANGCVRVQTQRVQHHKPGSVPANHI
jgi:hypothetical protein